MVALTDTHHAPRRRKASQTQNILSFSCETIEPHSRLFYYQARSLLAQIQYTFKTMIQLTSNTSQHNSRIWPPKRLVSQRHGSNYVWSTAGFLSGSFTNEGPTIRTLANKHKLPSFHYVNTCVRDAPSNTLKRSWLQSQDSLSYPDSHYTLKHQDHQQYTHEPQARE